MLSQNGSHTDWLVAVNTKCVCEYECPSWRLFTHVINFLHYTDFDIIRLEPWSKVSNADESSKKSWSLIVLIKCVDWIYKTLALLTTTIKCSIQNLIKGFIRLDQIEPLPWLSIPELRFHPLALLTIHHHLGFVKSSTVIVTETL